LCGVQHNKPTAVYGTRPVAAGVEMSWYRGWYGGHAEEGELWCM